MGKKMRSSRQKTGLSVIFFGILMTVCLVCSKAQSQNISFKKKGELVQEYSVEELKKKFPIKDIQVFEPHEKKIITYSAFEAASLLKKIFGPQWAEQEEILFTCSDGYQPSVPSYLFKGHQSFLAFSIKERNDFSITNVLQNNEKVALGPLYLIWDNLKSEDIKKEGASIWPYQVVGLDLISFAERFPKMAPPPGSSDSVQKGFHTFRKRCMSCHTINGEGGSKTGVELNYPVNAVEMIQPVYLRQWIKDPSSVRYGSKMPAQFRDESDPSGQIDELINYLSAMKNRKIKP
ncbi:MAG: hypothetical protein KA436_02585 [Oligoflexales bacterium]|nr:hypothetical protein [Oligoflexales bacterium]